jgi:putative sigma-54 modulation protein
LEGGSCVTILEFPTGNFRRKSHLFVRRESMEIVFTGKNIEVTEALKEFTKEKLEKPLKHIRNALEAHVFFSVEKHRHIAEVVIRAKANTFKASEETGDMYSSIGLALDKIDNQVKRIKGKHMGQKRRGSPKENRSTFSENPPEEPAPERSPGAITDTDYEVKPMSVEEAAMQVEFSSEPFVVFRNSATERINVIYRKDDGDMGLIDAGES